MEPTSPPIHKITNSFVNEPPNANIILHKYQKKIVTQISKTQCLIQTHFILLILMDTLLMVYMVPFLFIEREPRIIVFGVMIIVVFIYALLFQFLRKKPVIHEGHKYLRTLRRHSSQAENDEFDYDISQYLRRLYKILFFDRKKKLNPSAFLEPYEEEQYTAISNQMMTSLKNNRRSNSFLGAIQILSACLAIVVMPERVTMPLHAILLALVLVVYVISTQKSIILKDTMNSWMKGFNELQSWARSIERTPFQTSLLQVRDRKAPDERDFDHTQRRINCPVCGESDQKPEKYCQNCGKMISSQFGEA